MLDLSFTVQFIMWCNPLSRAKYNYVFPDFDHKVSLFIALDSCLKPACGRWLWTRRLQSQVRSSVLENVTCVAKQSNVLDNCQNDGSIFLDVKDNLNAIIAALKSCTVDNDLQRGSRIHAYMLKRRLLGKDVFLGNALVNMYAKCGDLHKAKEVFNQLPVQDLVSWTALITGYATHGCGEQALDCFQEMQQQGLRPDVVTFLSILKACGSIGALDKGEEIHAKIINSGLLQRDAFIGNALMDMYVKCGVPVKAQEVFDTLPVRDIVSWNVLIFGYAKRGAVVKAQQLFDDLKCPNLVSWNGLITGYAEHGHGAEVVGCFQRIQLEGLLPNRVTFISLMKGYGVLGSVDKAKWLHAQIIKCPNLINNILVGNALVDMYAKCGAMTPALETFNNISAKDVVSWTTLVSGYAQHGFYEKALLCFDQMQQNGMPPNAVTIISILKACGNITAVEKGNEIHSEIVRLGLLENNVFVGLVDMYAKFGELDKAREVFDKLTERDVVSWTALIAGYVEHEYNKEALNCFEEFQSEGLYPDAMLLIFIMKTCGSLGAAERGMEIHACVVRERLIEQDVFIGNAIIDMYAKCSLLGKAEEVFNDIPSRDVVSWNTLILGYAQLGKEYVIYQLLQKMMQDDVKPNSITFIILLNASSHLGLVNEGQSYLDLMISDYGIAPTFEHYTCIVNLLGRAGCFHKAEEIISEMPASDYPPIWTALLSSCQNMGNMRLATWVFQCSTGLINKDCL